MDKDFNDKIYGQFDYKLELNFGHRIQKVLQIIQKLKGKRILDVGCIDGYMSKYFNEMGFHTIGIDISKVAIEKAKKVCKEAYIIKPNEALPIKESSIDIIYAGEIIEHLFETEKFLKDMYRVAKKEGYLILTTPNIAWYLNRIFFLIGWQPISSEVGVIHNNYGNPLKRKISHDFNVAGHIRPFAYLAI